MTLSKKNHFKKIPSDSITDLRIFRRNMIKSFQWRKVVFNWDETFLHWKLTIVFLLNIQRSVIESLGIFLKWFFFDKFLAPFIFRDYSSTQSGQIWSLNLELEHRHLHWRRMGFDCLTTLIGHMLMLATSSRPMGAMELLPVLQKMQKKRWVHNFVAFSCFGI